MPPKKNEKTKDKEKTGDFETVTYTSNQLRTATTLLTVEDDAVIIKSLDHLNKYLLEHCEYKMILLREAIIEKMHKTVERKNEVIIKLTLKLITELLRDNKVKEAALPDFKYKFIDRLFNLICETKNDIIKEYSLYTLLNLISSERLRSYACTLGFPVKLFFILGIEKDPDVQRNSLDILCNLMNPIKEVWDAIPPPDAKYPKLLLCYLIHEFREMQVLAMRLLEQLTQYQCSNFHQVMVDCKVVEKMLDMLQDSLKEFLHDEAKNVALNLISCENLSHCFIKSEEFKLYLKFIQRCPEKYLVAACEILRKVCCFVNFHQPLFDFSAHSAVLSMFRSNDHKIHAGLCLIIKDLMSYEPFCENLLSEDSLGHIIVMLTHEDTFRTALVTIHGFLKNNKRTLNMLYKLRGFDKIFSIFLDNQSRDEEYFDIISDVVHTYCSIAAYSEEILTDEFCRVLLQRFKENPLSVLKLMNCYVHNEEFLKIFLENDGPQIFVNTVKIINEEQTLKQIIIFIHAVVAHKEICKRFLKDRLYASLQTISKNVRERIPLICHLEDKLYDMYLPLKFHIKGRLEIADKLESGFYLIDGYWNEEFPFLTTLFNEHITTSFTIYTVDYSYGATVTTKSKESFCTMQQQSSTKANVTRMQSLENKLYVDSEISLQRKGSLSETVVDRYLPVLILSAFKIIYAPSNASLNPIDRASMLAFFVESKTSGNEDIETPEQHAHYYGYHIATLKQKFASNLIPIGYIRSGRHCERALLFKAIADKIGIPSTLVKGRNGLYWNEIPLPVTYEKYMTTKTRKNYMVYGIVDLMENVGSILTVGSASAKRYCQIRMD